LAPKPGRNGYRHTGSVTLIDNSLNLATPARFISSLVRIIENDSGLRDGNERVSGKLPTSNPEFGFAEFARQFLGWRNKSKNGARVRCLSRF
jgi:hypothetical protein